MPSGSTLREISVVEIIVTSARREKQHSTPAAPAREDWFELTYQLREVPNHRHPQNVQVDLIIVVDQFLPHPNDSFPGNLRILSALVNRNSIRRFAYDFDEALERQANLTRAVEVAARPSPRHRHCLLPELQHVTEALMRVRRRSRDLWPPSGSSFADWLAGNPG